jgi:hypothetical protein
MKDGKMMKVPVLTGLGRHEGAFYYPRKYFLYNGKRKSRRALKNKIEITGVDLDRKSVTVIYPRLLKVN